MRGSFCRGSCFQICERMRHRDVVIENIVARENCKISHRAVSYMREMQDQDMNRLQFFRTMVCESYHRNVRCRAGSLPIYSEDIQCAGFDHDHYQEATCAHHEEHMMHDCVQLDYVVNSHDEYTSDSNIIMCDQYVRDNEVPVVHSGASSVLTDTFMMIYDDMCEPHDQSVSYPSRNTVVKNSLTAELAIYKEHVELVAIGYKNPLCLTRAKQAQHALYNGHEIIKDNHIQAIVHNSEDTLEIAEITRKKINDKMNDPECVTRKVKITPHDYLKVNLLATFTPQKQLTPEQIFWSNDLMKMKSEALKERTKVSRPIKAFTVYPPNTPAALVPKVLPTKSQVKILIFTLIKLFLEFDQTCKKRITPSAITDGEKGFEQTKACYLQELNYQNLKDQIRNSPPTPDKDTPDFDSVFVIGKMQASLQGKDNVIHQLKKGLSQLQVTRRDTDHALRHYKELYDSIKITRAKHIKQVTKVTTENMNLKTGVSKATVNPLVSARDKHAIDVEPIVPRLRNNRNAHLDYLRHLKESVETIRDIVEETKVVWPLDRSIVSACRYTKHSQELLEYAIGTFPQGSQPRAKQLAYIPLIRKKQVIVAQLSNKLDSTTHLHVVTVTSQKTNIPVPPSTGVDCCPTTSESQPMSHVKPNRISPRKDKMADVNAPSGQTPTMAPLVRADDQILPHIRWVPIGKSNCYLDLEKSQSNPIYKIVVDLLKKTNFFRAFTASSNRPSIYIQQFWDTILYDKKAGWKKRATLIVISSIRFTKLIIHHLQRKHRFHPRPDSPLYLSNEEPVLGYLKFSAKASYYQEYQENVAKHRGFLAGETGSNQDLPVPKLAKPARKPQSTAQKAPPKPSISSSVTSTQPAPTLALAKSRENKRKQATGTTDKPAKAKRIKRSVSHKTRQPRRSPKSVGASEAEEVPTEEPQAADEDADYQKAMEESIPVDQYIFQRRVSKPTASSFHDESPYEVLGQSDNEEESKKIVVRVEKGGQDEGQAGSNPDETSEGQAGSNPDETSKGQAGPDLSNAEARVQSTTSPVVHAGSDRAHMDLDVVNVSPQPSTEQLDEGFTTTVYPNVQENLKLAIEEPVLLEEPASSSGTLSSLQHLSRDSSFGDQFFSDKHSDADKNKETKVESMVNVMIQQALSSISLMTSAIIDLTSRPESPKEHQQLKATTTITLPPSQDPQQITTEAMMVKRIGELEHILVDLNQVNKTIEERLDKHGARLYTFKQLDIPQQVSIAVSEVVTDAVDWAMQAPLRNRFRDLSEADMKEILHQRMWESDSYKSHEDHMQLFEALEKSMNRDHSEELAHDLAEARKKRKKGRESPKTPHGSPSHQPPPPPPPASLSRTLGALRAFGSQVTPPPPPPTSTNQDSPSKGSATPSPSKTAATTKHQAWTTPDVTLKPLISLTPADLDMDKAMGPDEQAQLSDEEDIESAHIIMVNLRQGWWKPFEEERPTTSEPAWSIRSSDAPTGDIATFMDWFYKRRGITELKPQDLEGPAYEIVKVFHPDVIHLQYQMEECYKLMTDSVEDPILRHNVSKPLPLEGLPGQVTIQSDFFFNKDLEYLRYGSKGRRPALSISKMKAAYYPDAGLEQMVPDYTVRIHMRILSVVRIEVFFMYGYDYMKKIVLRRHLNHLPPKDKKILTTSVNKWTRQLVIRQRIEDFQLGIESYQTQVNLTKPQWTATGFEYKHDYTVIESPRAVIFRDKYGVQMMMRFNEIHKFSDGTLQQIVEALDYRVKEFRINMMNPEEFEDTENLSQHGELCWRTRQRGIQTFEAYRLIKLLQHSRPLSDDLWQSAPAFGHSKSKRTIESRAKRSSKIISLGHDSTLLASSCTVKMKMEILLEPTSNKLLVVGFNSLVHSLHALSALRRSGLRTASTAAKPCQGDSSKFYLITCSIHTDQRGTVVLATLFNESEQRHFRSVITNVKLQEHRRLQLLAKRMSTNNSMLTFQTHYR
uniref:Uncharacterized protein n=1 Tax=Tanacetum cinerariifolium TaxID=118510 RepID=A0A6L2MIN7_TANCI|nr:hypothetical protein [Tanacetum cinerariifolium]